MNVFYTADTHWFHSNILKYCNRPFQNVIEMNEVLIENWNKKVSKNDLVYHLGDFAFVTCVEELEIILKRLNGRKILIQGNHDRSKIVKNTNLFEFVTNSRQDYAAKVGNEEVYLSHCPRLVWEKAHYGVRHLFGHCHGNVQHPYPNAYDIGVDNNNYEPIAHEELPKLIPIELNK